MIVKRLAVALRARLKVIYNAGVIESHRFYLKIYIASYIRLQNASNLISVYLFFKIFLGACPETP